LAFDESQSAGGLCNAGHGTKITRVLNAYQDEYGLARQPVEALRPYRYEEQDALGIILGAHPTEELRWDGDSVSPHAFEACGKFPSLLTLEARFGDDGGLDLDALGEGLPSKFDAFEDSKAFGSTSFSLLSAPDGFE